MGRSLSLGAGVGHGWLHTAVHERWRRYQRVGALVLATVCVALVASLPLLALVAELTSSTVDSLSLLQRWDLWALFLRSAARALLVTLLSLAVGIPLGCLFGRSDLPLRRILWLVHAFPLFLPPFLLALGWFHLVDLSGVAGAGIGGRSLSGEPAVTWVLTFALAPIVTTLTAFALRGIEPSLEEAALVVARPLHVFRSVLLPGAAPAVALASVVVFSLAISELGVPLFFGTRAYSEVVFSRLAGIDFNPGEAVALATPLLVAGLLLVVAERRLFGRRRFDLLGLRESRQPIELGRWRSLATAVVLALAAAGVAPLAGLVWRAMVGPIRPGQKLALGDSLWTSLSTAFIAAAAATAIACVVGHALVRRSRIASILDGCLFLAFVMPSAVLGVGLISAWNRPATQWVYTTTAILVIAGCGRYAILAVRSSAVAFAQSSPQLEEAGQVAGASFLRRLVMLVLRPHWRGLALAFLLTLVFCMRDLDTVILFYPPGAEPLTVRLFTLEANGPPRLVAALALVQVVLVAGAVTVGSLLLSLGARRR